MDTSAINAMKEVIVQAVNECMDPEVLDLIFKLLSYL